MNRQLTPSRLIPFLAIAFAYAVLTAFGQAQAQDFAYTNSNGTITIMSYTGAGGNVTIPSTIVGLPVTSIGDFAFFQSNNVTSVTIPDTVTNIGDWSFAQCRNLAGVTFGNSVASIGGFAFNNCPALTRVALPDSVTTLRSGLAPVGGTFAFCLGLTNVILGAGLTNIGDFAFSYSDNVTSLFFRGNPTTVGMQAFDECPATVYYLPGAIGWGQTFGGLPTMLWNPQAQTVNAQFGIGPNGFGFDITGTTDIPLVIEAGTTLAGKPWAPLQTCTLTNGLIHFTDPQWTNYPARFYRIRSP